MNNFFLNQDQIDNLKECEGMFAQLMQKALEGKQSDFEFIKS